MLKIPTEVVSTKIRSVIPPKLERLVGMKSCIKFVRASLYELTYRPYKALQSIEGICRKGLEKGEKC